MAKQDVATFRVALTIELELEHGPAGGVADKLRRVIAESLDNRTYSVLSLTEETRFSRVRTKRLSIGQVEEEPRLL